MPRVKVVHGRWGEVTVAGQVLAEVTGIEYSVEIERIDVPQVGARWNTFTEGVLSGSGTLRMHKLYSRWETVFQNYAAASPETLRQMRDGTGSFAGSPRDPRPGLNITISLDDPHSLGVETETITDVLFWSYSGGFSLTDVVSREWPFTFEGIIPGSRIDPAVTVPGLPDPTIP